MRHRYHAPVGLFGKRTDTASLETLRLALARARREHERWQQLARELDPRHASGAVSVIDEAQRALDRRDDTRAKTLTQGLDALCTSWSDAPEQAARESPKLVARLCVTRALEETRHEDSIDDARGFALQGASLLLRANAFERGEDLAANVFTAEPDALEFDALLPALRRLARVCSTRRTHPAVERTLQRLLAFVRAADERLEFAALAYSILPELVEHRGIEEARALLAELGPDVDHDPSLSVVVRTAALTPDLDAWRDLVASIRSPTVRDEAWLSFAEISACYGRERESLEAVRAIEDPLVRDDAHAERARTLADRGDVANAHRELASIRDPGRRDEARRQVDHVPERRGAPAAPGDLTWFPSDELEAAYVRDGVDAALELLQRGRATSPFDLRLFDLADLARRKGDTATALRLRAEVWSAIGRRGEAPFTAIGLQAKLLAWERDFGGLMDLCEHPVAVGPFVHVLHDAAEWFGWARELRDAEELAELVRSPRDRALVWNGVADGLLALDVHGRTSDDGWPMRTVMIGNSGSGKSTLARSWSRQEGVAVLDLDTIAWEPGKIAVARDRQLARADVARHCAENVDWIVEGCYADLIAVALPALPVLVFLDPGTEACIENCRARPWEPHKYASKAEQDAHVEALIAWVREYDTREGELGRKAHEALFEAYRGPKARVTELPREEASL